MQVVADRWLAIVRALGGETREAILLLEGALAIGQGGPDILVQMSVAPEIALLYTAGGQVERAAPLVRRCRGILADGEDWRRRVGVAARDCRG